MNDFLCTLVFTYFFVFSTQLFGIVVHAPNLGIIEDHIVDLDENALIVFDVDYTIIVYNDRVLAPCGEVYFQEFRNKLLAQLDSHGINFNWSFPSIDSIILDEFEGKGAQPIFKQGVLASARYPKGQVLAKFLLQIKWMPSKIIFVDDKMEHIESVETELAKEQIPLLAFHYTAAIDQPWQLDKQIADFQFDYLMQQGDWLSDDEAKSKMNVFYTWKREKP